MSEKIAFIGVGNMGNPMVENLIKSGKKVRVYDVSKKMQERAKEKNKSRECKKEGNISSKKNLHRKENSCCLNI